MNPILLLGELAGAQTMTAAWRLSRTGRAVRLPCSATHRRIGHILLTTWGTVIVGMIAGSVESALHRPRSSHGRDVDLASPSAIHAFNNV